MNFKDYVVKVEKQMTCIFYGLCYELNPDVNWAASEKVDWGSGQC